LSLVIRFPGNGDRRLLPSFRRCRCSQWAVRPLRPCRLVERVYDRGLRSTRRLHHLALARRSSPRCHLARTRASRTHTAERLERLEPLFLALHLADRCNPHPDRRSTTSRLSRLSARLARTCPTLRHPSPHTPLCMAWDRLDLALPSPSGPLILWLHLVRVVWRRNHPPRGSRLSRTNPIRTTTPRRQPHLPRRKPRRSLVPR
jgi:hypothetical protein